MKIYLAARYSRRAEMQGYANDLARFKHIVTSRWINGSHDTDDAASDAERWRFAEEDLEDITYADLLINFTETPRTMNSSRGGRHVEFGYGFGLSITCWIVGPRENVFHYLVDDRFVFPSWNDVLARLETVNA